MEFGELVAGIEVNVTNEVKEKAYKVALPILQEKRTARSRRSLKFDELEIQ